MRTIQKTIDINAHIEELKCEINVDAGNTIAKISFVNLGFGDITAIKFNACGYNSFGDIVPIDGKEKFFLIIQDVMIAKNESATDLKAKLPNADIKKLDLEECQICYADGSVATYMGNNCFTLDLEEINNNEQLSALHKLYDKNARIKPKEIPQGWICSCGRFNKSDKGICSLCGKNKADTIRIFTDDNLDKLVEEYKISEEKEREAKEAEEKRLKKEKKKRNIIIGIVAIVCIILAFPIGNAIIMSQRTTYSSESEMKEALQGKYTYYRNGDAYRQIEIKDNQFRYIYSNIESNHWMEIDWFPEEGKIHTFEDIIVTNTGDLKVDGELYEQGGYMSTNSGYSSSNYESGYSVLDICDLEWDSNSSYTVCVGKVKNTGTKTYYYVEVKGSFKDSSGNVLDTDWTYAVGSEGLAPGESSSFRLSVDKDYDITDCSVSILDFD